MSATLAEQIEARHQRRLRGLAACGPKVATVVRALGGTPRGAEPTPAELATGLRRLGEWSHLRLTLADLEMPPGWLRLARLIGAFRAAAASLRPRRKPLFLKR